MNKLQTTVKRLRDTADELECLYKDTATPDLKAELLKHYGHGKPVLFCQVDGFTNVHPGDCVMHADEERHCVMQSTAYELRHTSHAVRLQIRQGTSNAEAVALLQKILAFVKTIAKERGPDAFAFASNGWPEATAADEFAEVPF